MKEREKKSWTRWFFALLPAFLFCAAALLLWSRFLPPAPVWITDNGNKYMILRHFAETGSVSFSPADASLFPLGGFHFVAMPDGRVQSFHAWVLPVITAPVFRWFGDRVVAFWPAAATLGILLLLGFQKKKRLIAWALLIGSPLLFYSLLLWEMTPSIFFALAGWLLLLKKRYFWAGILLGAGIWFREEIYFFSAALGIALLLRKEWKGVLLCALGALLTVLPLWGLNYEICGHFLGLHGSRYALNNNPEAFGWIPKADINALLFNFYQHGFRFEPSAAGSIPYAVIASAILLIAGAVSSGSRWFKAAALFLYCALMGFLVWALYRTGNPLYTAAATAGLIPSIPLAVGFFLHWKALAYSPKRKISLTTLAVLLYLLCVPLFLTISDIGLTWGPRHFFCILPMLCYLSFHALKEIFPSGRARKWILGLLFILSAAIQFWGISALVHVAAVNAAGEEMLRKYPEKTVVTDLFFLPEETPKLFFEKEFCEVLDNVDAEELPRYLKQQGRSSFLLLLSTDAAMRRMSPETLKKVMERYPVTKEPERLSIAPGLELFAACCAERPAAAAEKKEKKR